MKKKDYLYFIGIVLLVIMCVVMISTVLYHKIFVREPDVIQQKFVQVDLVKISSDYMQKSILLVAQVNQNIQLTPDQKLAKSQDIMKIVGTSLDSILDDYSKVNKVVVLQKQMIASDSGLPIFDITNDIESQIDSRINPDQLHAAAAKN